MKHYQKVKREALIVFAKFMSNAIKGKFKYFDCKELFFHPEVLRIAPDFNGRALGACVKSAAQNSVQEVDTISIEFS